MYILEVMKKNTDLSVSYLTYPKSMKVACSANETTILVQYSLTFKVVYLLPMKYIYESIDQVKPFLIFPKNFIVYYNSYFCYNMMTSQGMLSEAQFKFFFI